MLVLHLCIPEWMFSFVFICYFVSWINFLSRIHLSFVVSSLTQPLLVLVFLNHCCHIVLCSILYAYQIQWWLFSIIYEKKLYEYASWVNYEWFVYTCLGWHSFTQLFSSFWNVCIFVFVWNVTWTRKYIIHVTCLTCYFHHVLFLLFLWKSWIVYTVPQHILFYIFQRCVFPLKFKICHIK